jgi:hypothetical protein
MNAPTINMSNLITGLDDLISTANNVANGKVSSGDREVVNQFSNLLHGNAPHTSTGFFNTMPQKASNLTSDSSLNF